MATGQRARRHPTVPPYAEAIVRCAGEQGVLTPVFRNASTAASVAITRGAQEGSVAYKVGAGTPTWMEYDPEDPIDQATIETLCSRRARGWPGVADSLETKGKITSIDLRHAPSWALPSKYVRDLGGSVASARDGMMPLLDSLVTLRVNPRAALEDGAIRTHAGWVERNLHRFDEKRELMVPFSMLPIDEQEKDTPYVLSVESLRRILQEVHRRSTTWQQMGEVPLAPETSLEEQITGMLLYNEMLTVMSRVMHATYQAHFQSRGEPRIREYHMDEITPIRNDIQAIPPSIKPDGSHGPFRCDITTTAWDDLPSRFKASNIASARITMATLTNELAVRDTASALSASHLLESFHTAYVMFHDQNRTGAVRPDQRRGFTNLPQDEKLLNARMVDSALAVFRELVRSVRKEAAGITHARQIDPVAWVLGKTTALHHLEFSGSLDQLS